MNYSGAPTQEVLSAIIASDKKVVSSLIEYLKSRLEVHNKICRTASLELEVRRSQGAGHEVDFLLYILENANAIKAEKEDVKVVNTLIDQYKIHF